jgi:lipopolysaccharide export system protein LptA
MTSWQKRLRIGLAIFGIVFAGLVYRSIGERRVAGPPSRVERSDPKAISEARQFEAEQVRGTEREFEIKSERSLTYEDGSAKHFNIEITVRRGGKVFVVTAAEAAVGANEVELKLAGGVKVAASDGFELLTDHGTFNQSESIARAPGDVTFQKGLMSGSGANAIYNQKSDVLNIAEHAKVVIKDQAGNLSLDGSAGSAILDRTQDVLFMDSAVHVLRGMQTIDAAKSMARLSPDEDVVTSLELRGNASVQGGSGPLQSMKANAIDLDYTDDGSALERAILNGSASFSTAPDEQTSSRHISGEGLDVQMAPDGSVARVAGRDGVQLDLAAGVGTPARSIRARTLDAGDQPGEGLNSLRFRDDVVFQEDTKSGSAPREVRARTLEASLTGDGLSAAVFSGGVTFKERGLEAGAVEAHYEPAKNALSLYSQTGRRPYVTDETIHVEANEIVVRLDTHGMAAKENVRTTFSGRSSTAKDKDRDSGRLPGLFKDNQQVSVNAERLAYEGSDGRAEYEGNATLVQGDATAIRGDVIALDQQKGDLVASGSARSTITLESGRTDGRANEIRYDDARRTVTYSAGPVAPTTGQGTSAPLAQVSGPDGDLRAEHIDIVLAGAENAVERLEAYNRVTMVLGARTATGGRLTYHAKDERYVMSGSGVIPVSIRESCRDTIGRTLTFFKSTERIIVDGNETRRTETKPCTPPSPVQTLPSPVTR